MRKQWITGLALAVLLSVGIGPAGAASVSLSSVSGSWTSLTPPVGPTNVNGIKTNAVNWGTPGTPLGQSGYRFDGAAAAPVVSGSEFDLGVFTHNNHAIKPGTSITGATLSVGINILIGGTSKTIDILYDFAHLETVNNPGRRKKCADSGKNGVGVNKNGCADKVTIGRNAASTNTFVIDGVTYILDITGFLYGGTTLTEFWTTENLKNSAILRARLTVIEPPPPPSPVPLPAAGSLLMLGLAGFAAVRKLRRTT